MLSAWRKQKPGVSPPETLKTWDDLVEGGLPWEDVLKLARTALCPWDFRVCVWVDLLDIQSYKKKYADVTVLETHADFRTITNDVRRTFHDVDPDRDVFEPKLTLILHKFVSTYPDFGYVQGMNEVAATLMHVFANE